MVHQRERERAAKVDNEKSIGKGPSPVLIVAGAAVVLILIGVILYFLFGGGGVNSVVVGNIDKDVDGISFPIYTSVDGAGEYDGDVSVEIIYTPSEVSVYSGKAKIKNGDGSHSVKYTDFVWGNGDYEVHAKANGHGDFILMRIDSVADRIVPEWKGWNSNNNRTSPDYKVEVTIGYMFGARTSPDSDDPQWYSFQGILTGSDGATSVIDSSDYPANLLRLTRSTAHDEKGTYTLSGGVTNEFCHPDSPYRTVNVDENGTFTFDARPFAVIGEDIKTSLIDGEAEVTFDASGSWDDSAISEYIWYLSTEDNDVVQTTNVPTFSYTFAKTGVFYVTLDLEDDGGNMSDQYADISTMVVTVE